MRLPYTHHPAPPASPHPDPSTQQIVDSILTRRHPHPLTSLDLTLLHSPPLAAGWNTYLRSIRTETVSLPAELRELAICRVAVLLLGDDGGYVWHHHAPLLLESAGWEGEGMLDILRKEDVAGEGGLSVRQKAVIRYADAMTKQVKVEEEVWVDLRRESGLDERGLVELTATIATYNMVARFVGALDVGEMNGIGGDEGGSKWGVK